MNSMREGEKYMYIYIYIICRERKVGKGERRERRW